MKDLEPVLKLLADIIDDRTVPKNIRAAAEQVKNDLSSKDDNLDIKLSSAINILDEVTNDPNIPMYTRTQVWNIVSMLEMLRKKL